MSTYFLNGLSKAFCDPILHIRTDWWRGTVGSEQIASNCLKFYQVRAVETGFRTGRLPHPSVLAPPEDEVWQKGHVIQNADPNVWRTDDCGALMNREQYGTQTEFGWQIDHPNPQTGQETEYSSELRPLQWLNSQSRKRGPLTCPVSWEDSHNSVTCKNCSARWYPTTTTCPNCGTAV